MLPAKHKIESTREKRWRCPSHLAWVRKHKCCVPDCDWMPIEACHVRTGTDGGTGMKPSDNWVISLCQFHHRRQHQLGEPEFEQTFGLDMKELAQEFFAKSPHRVKKRKVA